MSHSIKCEITCDELQVGRSGQKKKARMARTRSDFLTRAPVLSVGGQTDEEDVDADGPLSPLSPRHYTLPLPSQSSTEAGSRESCFSDSDMVTRQPEPTSRGRSSFSGFTFPVALFLLRPPAELPHVSRCPRRALQTFRCRGENVPETPPHGVCQDSKLSENALQTISALFLDHC